MSPATQNCDRIEWLVPDLPKRAKGNSGYLMGKSPRVVFHPKRIAEGDWQIEAHFPEAEIRYITGLTDKADIDDWMGGSRKIAWLRSQGYAK